MGIFDKISGAFEKKNCDVCGNEIKLLGNKKLEDGNLCKECASKLSPFFSDRRRSTVEQIRQQLAYREANKSAVAAFNCTRSLGNGRKVLVDEAARKFIVTSSSNWRNENPDVIDCSQVTGCVVDVRESRSEIKYRDEEGHEVSYQPPRYDIDYDVYTTIHVNSPYFDSIEVKVNERRIEEQYSAEFRRYQEQADEIRKVLMDTRETIREAAKPRTAVKCPNCGATTMPDVLGRCEFCGGAVAR